MSIFSKGPAPHFIAKYASYSHRSQQLQDVAQIGTTSPKLATVAWLSPAATCPLLSE